MESVEFSIVCCSCLPDRELMSARRSLSNCAVPRCHKSTEVRKTRKSPSTRARNRLRLERFLAKKKASTVPATSSPEPDCRGCPLELLGIASNQTAPDGKGRTSSEINLPTTSNESNLGKATGQHQRLLDSSNESNPAAPVDSSQPPLHLSISPRLNHPAFSDNSLREFFSSPML